MSHEIRTPMTVILGHADLLADPETPDPERTRSVERIRRHGRHLLDVINDILDLSKIEAGKMVVERIPCSPVDLVDELVSLLRPQAIERGLGLGVEYRGAIPERVRTDPSRVRQILVNLVGNAIKFTEAGEVRVAVGLESGAEPPRLRFEVIDTGIGLDREACAALFTPFMQADASTRRPLERKSSV